MGNKQAVMTGVIMPIPAEFEARLRNDEALQLKYREFINTRTYQIIPNFIQQNKVATYDRIIAGTAQVTLIKWDNRAVSLSLAVEPYSNDIERVFMTLGSKVLFKLPNLLNTAPPEIKAEILRHFHSGNVLREDRRNLHWTDCIYSDMPILRAISYGDRFGKAANPRDLLIGREQDTEAEFNEMIAKLAAMQMPEYTYDDFITGNVPSGNIGDPIYNAKSEYDRSSDNNITLIGSKQTINIIWSQANDIDGSHAVSIYIDPAKKLIGVIDPNGVGNCELEICNYFARKFNIAPEEYTIIPIMWREDHMPVNITKMRAFQTISDGPFCQTWNLFCQRLVLDNDFGRNINARVFDAIMDKARPITYPQLNDAQMRLTVIMLEFMFYIRETMSAEFMQWIDDSRNDYGVALNRYMDSREEAVIGIALQMVAKKGGPTISPNEYLMHRGRPDVKYWIDQVEQSYIGEFKKEWTDANDQLAKYDINMATNEAIGIQLGDRAAQYSMLDLYDQILK